MQADTARRDGAPKGGVEGLRRAGVSKAVEEARRFLAAAADVAGDKDNGWEIVGSKNTGTLRRASMDLTRALAEMRKP